VAKTNKKLERWWWREKRICSGNTNEEMRKEKQLKGNSLPERDGVIRKWRVILCAKCALKEKKQQQLLLQFNDDILSVDATELRMNVFGW